MTRKFLNLDHSAGGACIDPAELSKEGQICCIYCPSLSKYVCVTSSSPVMNEQGSKFVETDSDLRGHGKQFKLASCSDGIYNIITVNEDGHENGFLYLSEKTQSGVLHRCSHVLKSENIIPGKEKQFSFEIVESESQWGLYKIMCCGKTLYATKGVQKYILADNKDMENAEEAWFQFNLKTRIVKKELTGNDKKFAVSQKDSTESSFLYKNEGPEAVKVKFDTKNKKFVVVQAEGDHENGNDLIPDDPIDVELKGEVNIKISSSLSTFVLVKKLKIETDSGKTFLGLTEQKCFHNYRVLEF